MIMDKYKPSLKSIMVMSLMIVLGLVIQLEAIYSDYQTTELVTSGVNI